ncbi:MAG TPA: carboxypeptidase regulatory-like domain-containing protein [Kofleriaceae bacterium]|nr:carboxypeptidase regulatory-like domain-containing protein [Kofleriaceae bacterium]
MLAAGGARVRGVVDDLGGRPLADAWVEADARDLDGEVPIVRARSAADGTFELWTAPGTVSVSAGADGYAEERATVEAPTDRIPLYLMPAGVISGVVVDGVTSEPIADAKVRVVSSITGSDDHPITSAADGTFRISGLTGGWYRVRAEVPGGWGESPENLLVGIGQTVADATIVMHRVGSVSGRIVIDGGAGPPQGCPHGSVVLIRPNRILVADSDSDGHVVFPSVTPGDYQVGFHCDDHPVREDAPPLTVGAEGAAGIVWTVARGERLTGTVRDHRGRPVRGALVEADAEDDQRCRHPKDWRAARPTGPSRSRGCYPVATVFTHPPATAPRSATRTPPSR